MSVRSAVTEMTLLSLPMTSMLPNGLSIQTEPAGSIGNSRTTRLLVAKLAPKSCVDDSSTATAMTFGYVDSHRG